MATPASLQDLEGAMNALRGEISAIVALQVAASITALRNEVSTSVSAALTELRQHSEAVDARVDARFQLAETGFTEEQVRFNGPLDAGQARLTVTQTQLAETLARLKVDLDAAVAKIMAVSDGKLDEVASQLVDQSDKMTGFKVAMASYAADQAKNIQVIHTIMSGEVRTMHGEVTHLGTTLNHRMGQVEQFVQHRLQLETAVRAQGEHVDTKSVFPIQSRGT